MRKLIVHESPRTLNPSPILTGDGKEEQLSAHFGPVLVVNFWATWCAPCRKEMPSLDRLQAEFEIDDVKVLAIASGRNEEAKIDAFLDSVDVHNLAIRLDPTLSVASSLLVRGLPVTLLLNRKGEEVARLTGDAEWDSPSALRIVKLLADSE